MARFDQVVALGAAFAAKEIRRDDLRPARTSLRFYPTLRQAACDTLLMAVSYILATYSQLIRWSTKALR